MQQTRFSFVSITSQEKELFDNKITDIYNNIKKSFKNFGNFQKVLIEKSSYHSSDLQ